MSVVQSQAEFCLQWNLGVELHDRQLKKPAILLNSMKSINSDRILMCARCLQKQK